MGGGLSISNRTGIEVLVTLSQVGPLHWERIRPQETKEIDCGQVWFTIEAMLWNGDKPSGWDVTKPILITVGATVTGAGVAAGTVGLATGTATAASGVAVAGVFGGTIGGVVAAGTCATNRAFSKKQIEENTDKWLAITPSKQSAKWLAEKNIIAVIPESMAGVYADGKTIILDYDLVTSEGGSRMTLKFLDEHEKPL